MTKRDDMPALPEPFVKPLAANGLASKPGLYTVGQFVRYAKQYAEQRVREERAEDERLLREAMGAMDMLMDALWKATGDDPELVSNYIECQGGDIRAIESTIAALRKRLGE